MELAGDPADRGFLQADVLVIIVALSVGFKIIVFGIILCFASEAVNDDDFVSRWIQEDSPILINVPFPFGRNSKGSAANGKGNCLAGRSGGSAVRRLAGNAAGGRAGGGSGLRGFIVVQQQHHQHNDQYNDQGGDS